MIFIYSKIPAKTIRKDAKETIAKLKVWFNEHPERKECLVEGWYGKTIIVKPKTIKQQIDEAVKEALK
jgi:hypothetical protein